MKSPSARYIAAGVVKSVLFSGGFTAAELDSALNASPHLEARDRALLTEIVYGVVRTRVALMDRLLALAPRGINDQEVLCHLLVAAYQMLLLDRVPAFAVVNEAVDEVRRLRGAKVAGFANALLRRLAKQPKLEREQALTECVPGWLWQQLEQAVSADSAKQLLGVGGTASITPTTIRWREPSDKPPWVLEGTQAAHAPDAFQFRGVGDVRRHPEYAEGLFVVQEEGAQLCGLALGVRSGERVLDACAGHGQKTSLIADQLKGTGELWATDLSPKKLKQLEREFVRLKLPPARTLAIDWSKDPAVDEALPQEFDRILVDAPCSGTGTLRRRPEILLRLEEQDVERLASLSEQILRHAAKRLGAEGRLLFVVCSVLRRECEDVVERVSDVLRPQPFDAPQLTWIPEGKTQYRLLPNEHGTDGFFLASFARA